MAALSVVGTGAILLSSVDKSKSGGSIRGRVHPEVVALEGLHEGLGMPLLSRILTGMKPGIN
jgi:hypothetical protein